MSERSDAKTPDRSAFVQGLELGTEELPVDQYYSERFFELEKEAIWKDSWLWVGRASDLVNPGDFFVFEFDVLHSSVIVVRGKDGKIRGFHNSCRHRGSPTSPAAASPLRFASKKSFYDNKPVASGIEELPEVAT